VSVTTVPVASVTLAGVATGAPITSIWVRERLARPAMCDITFSPDNAATAFAVEVGQALRVDVAGQLEALFEGDVTAVRHTHHPDGLTTVRVRGEDRLHHLRTAQTMSVLVDVDIVALATDLTRGLGIDVEPLTEPGARWPRLIPHERSDLATLVHRAAQVGRYPTLRGRSLRLPTLAGTGEPVALTLGGDLLEVEFSLDGRADRIGVDVWGWDPSGPTGRAAAADRSPAHAPAGPAGRARVFGAVVPSAVHADALAEARRDRSTAAAITVRGVATRPLRPATRLLLAGVRPDRVGPHIVTEAVHTLDPERGLLSQFDTAPPAVDGPAASCVTMGVVARVDDPEGRGRVTVTLPGHGDVESDWMVVALPGAGTGKGLVAVPDVGDRVLLACPRGDPGAGVIVGSVLAPGDCDDPGVVGGEVRRHSWRTPSGHRVTLDDEARTVNVSDASGSVLALGPHGVVLTSSRELVLEAPGHPVVIRGASIDLQRG
jgi:phage baseplate assembly protein gpV